MEKTKYFTAAKPITPVKANVKCERTQTGERKKNRPIMKQTEAKLSQPEAWRIFFGQRGKRQNRITTRQIPPPKIQ